MISPSPQPCISKPNSSRDYTSVAEEHNLGSWGDCLLLDGNARKELFCGRKFIVTGALGFVGKNLVEALRELESVVIPLDRESSEWSQAQIADSLSEVSCVFHVGADSNTLQSDISTLFVPNYLSSSLWSSECKRQGVPLIFSSSASVYGSNGSHPSNAYGWSKYVAEEFLVSQGAAALRYFNVYGPGESHKGSMASFAFQAFENDRKGNAVKLFPGRPSRDFVHVEDVVEANLTAFTQFLDCSGSTFDIGTGNSMTFERVLGILQIPFTYNLESAIPSGYQFFTRADVSKFLPGWKPRITPEIGFEAYRRYMEQTIREHNGGAMLSRHQRVALEEEKLKEDFEDR